MALGLVFKSLAMARPKLALEPIRASDVFAELQRLSAPKDGDGPEGFTGDELAHRMGVCHRTVMYRVKEWCQKGLIQYAGRRRTVNIIGAISQVPVYRLSKEVKT